MDDHGDKELENREASEEASSQLPLSDGKPLSDSASGQDAKMKISDELMAAMAEAEAAVDHHEKPRISQTAKAETDQGGEELDIDIEEAKSEGDSDKEPADEENFDPNRVDESEHAAPAPQLVSPREMELKMQILELRQQLRDRDKDLEQKIKELKQNLDQARHIQQQFENFKIRVQKERADWFNYGHEPLLKELLLVKDNLDRALEHSRGQTEVASLREGVELTLKQFDGALAKFGVLPVETAGEIFNPEFSQAMMQVEDDSVPNGTVVEVHQKGYMLKDRLLRPAMVTVSKKSAASAAGKEVANGGEGQEPEPAHFCRGDGTDRQEGEDG